MGTENTALNQQRVDPILRRADESSGAVNTYPLGPRHRLTSAESMNGRNALFNAAVLSYEEKDHVSSEHVCGSAHKYNTGESGRIHVPPKIYQHKSAREIHGFEFPSRFLVTASLL